MKTILLFPGYGSQFVGIGKELYDEYRIVQEYFEEASNCLNINFVKLCFASSDAELSKMVNAYTSLFLIGASVYAVLKEAGIEVDIVAGYNNGESTALCAAHCFSLPDGLYLLNKFCSFYQEFIDKNDVDAMRVIGVERKQLETICKQSSDQENKVFISICNDATDHIVAGHRTSLSRLQDAVNGVEKAEYIDVAVGLHSVLMNDVVGLFKDYLEKVDFKDVKIPMISSIDGALITSGIDIKDRFIRHINTPLDFTKTIQQLADYEIIIIAHKDDTLSGLIKNFYPEKVMISIAKKSDIDTIKEIVNK